MKRLLLLSSLMFAMTMNLSCSNQSVTEGGNPLLEEWTTEFGIPPFDKIRTEHFEPAFMEAMKMHNDEIAAIVASEEEPTFDNVIVAMDNAGIKLSEITLIFGMLSSSDLDAEMQEVQNKIVPIVDQHFNAIMLNDALFERVKAVYDKRKSLNLDEVQMRLVEKTYNKFVRSGALLEGEAKERLKSINAELSELSIRFGNNLLTENGSFQLILDETQVAELPESVKNQ
ncbi:MAG: peptidase M3, partial [Alistipes sp.]|nr:peptidase M3 [Alistipes sp.]